MPELPDVTLEAAQDTEFGFRTVTVAPGRTDFVYSVVTEGGSRPFDRFSITPADRHPADLTPEPVGRCA